MLPEKKLLRMANQIATFFASQPGPDKAERVAAHLKDFWGPEMRAELKALARSGHERDLDDLVRRALPMI
ncbi:formate dehydrogenase subunit delta [Roseibacterium sp. SDUM158016]|jgi:formate dehydrogenase subunit delta|uniref:formate dehydrogenase subunit delta n=1 Tax=Roseicyclus sediminis TaxID=2980997 RepID=UPI0021CE5FF9|nr:formate dehydrogenase subunit delta [Roseibacterium sp. SDUM158016]MCU4651718.1 formate dehydrogenase subunit delta [Roseibacterium sp. SDUM158016]